MALLRHHHRQHDHRSLKFWMTYPLSILFILHGLMVAYINSSYMEQYLTPEGVSTLFTVGSAVAVLAFLFFSHALRLVGNVKLTLILAILDIGALLTLASTELKATAIVAFVTFLIVNPLLYLNIDIFSESIIGNDESSTGSKRGFTLTLMSLAAVLAPLLMGVIADGTDNLYLVYYYAAGIFSLFVGFILLWFKTFEDPHYHHLKVTKTIRSLWITPDIRNVLLAHFTLQLFFTWAVIYIPLYMSTEMGLAWNQIGSIIAVGLFAYVLFELPIGWVADKYIGEKEIMALGFVVLAVSGSWITFMTPESTIVAWMILVFITRIGAAMVEATTESYFFKHTKGDDANVISFFRLLRPLALVAGSLIGSAALLYLPFQFLFIILGLLMVPGIFYTVALKDTK